jgi:catechol-2,3-dioxygenase
MKTSNPIGKNVRIGHVHLKVADLDRALSFYCDVLINQRKAEVKPQAFTTEA